MVASSRTAAAMLGLLASAAAFAPPQHHAVAPTCLRMSSGELPPIRDIAYGEESRKYRRTIFTHDDWVNYRSPDRFWRNLLAGPNSGVYKSVFKEILATTSVATFVVVYNCAVGGYTDFAGNQCEALINSPYLPLFGLPLAPFTLASPSLGLLLSKCDTTIYQQIETNARRSA